MMKTQKINEWQYNFINTDAPSSKEIKTGKAINHIVWVGIVGGTGLLAGLGLAAQPASAATVVVTSNPNAGSYTEAPAAGETAVDAASSRVVQPSVVTGTFVATQSEVTSNAEIARVLGGADKILCSGGSSAYSVSSSSSAAASPVDTAADWDISIVGTGVSNPLDATIGELSTTISQTQLMGCSCLGNPIDGRASVNADVTGIDLRSVLELAQVSDDANVITFTCSDGYSVSLPLSYVLQRKSLIVYEIGGAPLSESVGGTNQLWLGSTAARYFASDIVSITVDAVDDADVPAAPGTSGAAEQAQHTPNVALTSAR